MASISGQVTLTLDSDEQFEQYLDIVQNQIDLNILSNSLPQRTITIEVNVEV